MLIKWPSQRQLFLYLIATTAAVALTFFMLLTSEPYGLAEEFVANDPRVTAVTGTQLSRSLAPFKGFRSTYGDRTGEARFTLKVSGARGEFNVTVEMTKQSGSWAVISAYATSSAGETIQVVQPIH